MLLSIKKSTQEKKCVRNAKAELLRRKRDFTHWYGDTVSPLNPVMVLVTTALNFKTDLKISSLRALRTA
jgi:hypothetical protein